MGIREDELSPTKASKKITSDRLCPKCQYNLRGLRAGGQCPECGTVIKVSSKSRKHDTIANCEIGYLRRLNLGMLLIVVGALSFVVGPVLGIVLPVATAGIVASIMAVLLLPAGGWLITADRRSMVVPLEITKQDGRGLRMATRWVLVASVVLGGLAIGAAALTQALGGGTTIVDVLVVVTDVTSQVGLVMLMFVLSWLAAFEQDTDNEGRFRFCGFAFALFAAFTLTAPVLGWLGVLPYFFIGLLAIFLYISYIIAYVTFAFSTLSLWRSTNWAVKNWHAHRASEQRARDKFNDQRAKARAADPGVGFEPLAVDLKHATPAPRPVAGPPPTPAPPSPDTPVIQPPDDDGEIYGFADGPDDPGSPGGGR